MHKVCPNNLGLLQLRGDDADDAGGYLVPSATLLADQNNRVAARSSGNNSPMSDGGQATASAQWNTT